MNSDSHTISKMERPRFSRVMIVDDNESLLTTFAGILQEEGFAVTTCATAATALKKIAEENFGVAIVDLRLPDMQGIDLLKAFNDTGSKVRVIINTAYGEFESAKAAINHGAFAYVEKAQDPGLLVQQVHRAYQSHLESYVDNLEAAVAKRTMELSESERRYRLIVEDQTELIVRWSTNGTRIFANRAYCEYFGQSLEKVIGTSFFQTVKEEDLPAVQQKIASLSIERPVESDERRVITLNGQVRWNAWTDRAIFDEQNRIVEYQSVGRDITERKTREKRLSEKAKVAARMSLLTNREREVLGFVVQGKANKIIANELSISERTVEKHRANTMRKLNASSTAELVRISLITEEILATV